MSPNIRFLYFGKPWCKRCRDLKPTLSKLVDNGYNIEIHDGEDNTMFHKYDIKYLPTLVILVDDREEVRTLGKNATYDQLVFKYNSLVKAYTINKNKG